MESLIIEIDKAIEESKKNLKGADKALNSCDDILKRMKALNKK